MAFQMGYCCLKHNLGIVEEAEEGDRDGEAQRVENMENLRLNQRRVTNCMK